MKNRVKIKHLDNTEKSMVTLIRKKLFQSSIALTTLVPCIAFSQVVDISTVTPKAGQSSVHYQAPTIVVKGSGYGKYGSIETREMFTSFTIKGSTPKKDKKYHHTYVNIGDTRKKINRPKSVRIERMSFAYKAPLSEGGTSRLSPIELCNKEVKRRSGNGLKKFIRKGGTISLKNAYIAEATTSWNVKNGAFSKYATWTDSTKIGAKVKCLPTKNFARTSKNTSTSSHKPNIPRAKPTLKPLSLKVAAMNVKRIGNDMCPTQIRLVGRVDTRRGFKGESLFIGPHWLSRKTDIKLHKAGGRSIVATYPIKWNKGIGNSLSAGASKKPKTQTLTFKMNVATTAHKQLGSTSKTIKVTCKKPRKGIDRRHNPRELSSINN